MTVSLVTTWDVDASKMGEFVALGPDAKNAALALGVSSYRGFRSRVAGPNTGSFISVLEFENGEAMGRFLDAAPGDAAFSALLAKAADMANGYGTSVLDEIELG